MATYAMAHLYDPAPHPEVVEYIERIRDTLDPFGGRFIVHGPQVTVVEGEWHGTVVVIEFPDRDAAVRWYESPAYQAILPLRTNNIDGATLVFDGVREGYHPRETAAVLRQLLAASD
jgi:uncharacterized protein (DUF1330 family)